MKLSAVLIAALSAFTLLLAACGAPKPPEPSGSWTPVNQANQPNQVKAETAK